MTEIDNIDRFRNSHDMGAHDFDDEISDLVHALARRPTVVIERDESTLRVMRDESLAVHQVRPTNFLTSQVAVSSSVPVQAAYARRERLGIRVTNIGPDTVYIGNSQATAQPTTGFPIPSGGSVTLTALSDIWVSVATGSATVGILDEYRSESDGA